MTSHRPGLIMMAILSLVTFLPGQPWNSHHGHSIVNEQNTNVADDQVTDQTYSIIDTGETAALILQRAARTHN